MRTEEGRKIRATFIAEEGTKLLGRVPIYGEIRASGDEGLPLTLAHPEHPASQVFFELARQIVAAMPE